MDRFGVEQEVQSGIILGINGELNSVLDAIYKGYVIVRLVKICGIFDSQ